LLILDVVLLFVVVLAENQFVVLYNVALVDILLIRLAS
jgi:hypothetical protein